jgi:hypothetical protein
MNKGNGNEFRKSFFTTVHVLLDSVKSNGNALLVSAYHVNCGALIEFECGNLASVLLSDVFHGFWGYPKSFTRITIFEIPTTDVSDVFR